MILAEFSVDIGAMLVISSVDIGTMLASVPNNNWAVNTDSLQKAFLPCLVELKSIKQ